MMPRLHIAAGTLLLAAGLVGCEDAGKKPVQARVPAGAPATVAHQAPSEVAEMTFPVDQGLKGRAEEAAKNISHDLPLTVNDQVLSFLNFFQTPRGRAIVETGLRRAGRYREMISRVLREEGMPQDLIYLA